MNQDNKNRPYFRLGLTIFVSLSLVVLVFISLQNFQEISKFMEILKSALQPILIGLILGYLVAPLETRIGLCIKDKCKPKTAKKISVFSTTILVFAVIYITIRMLLPQVFQTIMDLSVTLPGMMTSFTKQIREWIQSDGQILALLEQAVDKLNAMLNQWIQTELYEVMTSLLTGIIDVFGFLFNIIIGFIVMIYVLFEKEKFQGEAKKILYAVSKDRQINGFILDTVRQCDKMFGGFITGKIIDSIIIGILCFICISFMKMPYVALISLIVGITNVIPFFGPYIGGIPCTFLVLLVDPMKALIFGVFIIILQQVDGNIIGPRILGESTGLSPFWVLFSILVAGELFGVVGMIIGVPLFATVYYVVKRIVEAKLKYQKLPTATEDYITVDKIDKDNHITHFTPQKKEKKAEEE